MGQAENAAVVREFYSAIVARDADRLGALVDESFADDASITWPDSLPHGGTLAGARVLRKVFGGMAASGQGPAGLEVVRVIADDDAAVAEVTFELGGIPSGALESWTFADGKVAEIKAYYWDTAALVPPSAS